MPRPVSLTTSSTCSPAVSIDTSMLPCGVNFTAFDNRFQTICLMRCSSAITGAGRRRSAISARPLASAITRMSSITMPASAPRSTGRGSTESLPVTIAPLSSKSSTMWASWRPLRLITSPARVTRAGSGERRISSHQLRIALSGERSSWLTVAMK